MYTFRVEEHHEYGNGGIPDSSKRIEFCQRTPKVLIDGRWAKTVSWKPSPTYRPAMGEVLAQVAEGNCADENCGRGLAGCDAETCKALMSCRAGIEESISHCSQKLPRYMLSEKGADPA
jgi:hypothetical protein